ncbi:MAG: haloacid dehalogenase [Sulfurovum sp.]|nr:haloacid dehalogenase [Sulfurovum sp.]
MIEIPNFDTLDLKHIVCDYNGTIAKDGILLPEIKTLFAKLEAHYTIHVITADTFGSVKSQLEGTSVTVKVLESDDHTQEKSDYVRSLGASHCVAIGNGNNDKAMLTVAELGIAIIGGEGCAKDALLGADLFFFNIDEALETLLHEKRLVATLRR